MTPATPPDADARTELRAKIVAEIMKLVRKPAVRIKPTIEELERILNSENAPDIQIDPDGTMLSTPQSSTTVGDIADAVLALLSAIPGEATEEVEARVWTTAAQIIEAQDGMTGWKRRIAAMFRDKAIAGSVLI